MTRELSVDERISTWLLEQAPDQLPDRVLTATFERTRAGRQRRTLPGRAVVGPWRPRSMFKPSLAAAAVVAVLVSGALLMTRPDQPAIADPSPSLPGVGVPSSTPSATAPTASAVTSPTGVWIATGTMGTPRLDHTAVRLLDGRVLVVGNFRGDNPESAVTSAELYDPVTGTWSATGSMLKPHTGFLATLLRDGRVLVGDIDDPAADNPVIGAELYDPATGTWSATGTMVPGAYGTATLLRDGTVLVTGKGSALFDPDSGTWTATRSMPAQRAGHAAILLPDGRVLVAGGWDDGDTTTDSAELYDPDTGAWTATANMHVPREGIDAFLQPDGKVLVVGGLGRGSLRGGPQSAELYDPDTGTWTATGEMSRAFQMRLVPMAATLLADGRVLMAGDGSTLAELYDPETGSWTAAAPMLRPHDRTPLTLLLDGTVLVAGGLDCLDVCVATGSAELYVPRGVSPPPLPAFPSPPPPVIPTPTPVPTLVPPEAGPVPPNARPWTVTVVNKSSQPATLFVAEEDDSGMTRLVGSVTPNVVPPGATVEVTFLLPAKRVKGWSIFVNPGPNNGLLGETDVPLAGYFYISEHGQVGWVSP